MDQKKSKAVSNLAKELEDVPDRKTKTVSGTLSVHDANEDSKLKRMTNDKLFLFIWKKQFIY